MEMGDYIFSIQRKVIYVCVCVSACVCVCVCVCVSACVCACACVCVCVCVFYVEVRCVHTQRCKTVWGDVSLQKQKVN